MSQRMADPHAYPAELEAAEAQLVRERRRSAGTQDAGGGDARLPDDTVGVGLSGGGIRSATFMLGVFQALAKSQLVRRIDFLSTVSGGGYFGSFLGRLFARHWMRGPNTPANVERALDGLDPQAAHESHPGWAARAFRWLRDNGRYLAPRGSGDVLVLGTILLRNWIAIQVVLVTTILTAFLGLQLLRRGLDWMLVSLHWDAGLNDLLVCTIPGRSYVWWSPWIVVALLPFVGVAVPAGWAYWLTARRQKEGLSPWVGAVIVALMAAAGTALYASEGVPRHPLRFAVSLMTLVLSIITIAFVLMHRDSENADEIDRGHLVRSKLTNWAKDGLVATGIVVAIGIVDTLGATVYTVTLGQSLSHWIGAIASSFAVVGAFGRQLLTLLMPSKPGTRPSVPASVVSWIAAVVVLTVWLVAIDVASHAVAWKFRGPLGAPAALGKEQPPAILGADHLVVTGEHPEMTVRAEGATPQTCSAPSIVWLPSSFSFLLSAFGFAAILTWVFGRTRSFANMSSIHTFYAGRLTRTYLGATNPDRLGNAKAASVTETYAGDDCGGQKYWRWPDVAHSTVSRPADTPASRGGPLHIINTTINETYDMRTKVQNQDRKGTILAIGPCGLSVGVRHHLVSTADDHPVALPRRREGKDDVHRVFTLSDEGATTPDPLSLGQWVSVSGAAFSAAAGANTTVPIAILCGLFNVRLGYWWNSGTKFEDGVFERLLPVQASLFAEMFARTTGTAGRRWNLSDGGHFENMGGYELIRRRLPVIVIIDAEADPDYTFGGLSDLVRMARLDFNAEITFLNDEQLGGGMVSGGALFPGLPAEVRPFFGNLDALRRGKWSNDELPYPPAPNNKSFAIEADRSRVSRAHAALAHVRYFDNGNTAWLVYVKATLMGDEPEDVCNYHQAHPDFPQEPTADQFFDEKQWESYRRLGQHAGHRVLTPELFRVLQANRP